MSDGDKGNLGVKSRGGESPLEGRSNVVELGRSAFISYDFNTRRKTEGLFGQDALKGLNMIAPIPTFREVPPWET